ncbi:ketoacyl-ACP synthase III [uncultured Selenomonas sp.]|uniref:ketoacyl-ACP synthase III n=1 Tax=uncultured Selenomonas sp. TaxID=159275 RepID=UPI0025E05008|nr:ketoacyl-ACP synthase III [uncultured Selenomonas sp.]
MGTYAAIRAIASYLPEKIEPNDPANPIGKKVGIDERHVAADDEAASDVAIRAAENLFAAYDIRPADIDFVLLCAQTPDYFLPTTACIVQDRLGIPQSAGALDYNLACSAYPYGLAMAKGIIETGMAKNILLLTSSVYERYINPNDGIIRPLFGDAGTATLVSAVESNHPMLDGFVFGSDGSRYDTMIIRAGASRHMPHTTPVVYDEPDARGNTRSNYQIYMNGKGMTSFTMHTVPPLVDSVLEKTGLMRQNLDGVVFHQANHFMLEKLRTRCGLDDVPFYNEITHVGNVLSGSIPYALATLAEEDRLRERHHVLLAGFGVGLSWGGCVADFGQLMPQKNSEK